MLCGFGFLINLRFGSQPLHYGIILLAAMFGLVGVGPPGPAAHRAGRCRATGRPCSACTSTPGRSSSSPRPWLGVALLLLLSPREPERREGRHALPMGGLSRFAAWLLILVTLANAAAAFALCGPVECPDNPTSYWLLTRF